MTRAEYEAVRNGGEATGRAIERIRSLSADECRTVLLDLAAFCMYSVNSSIDHLDRVPLRSVG